MDKTAVIYWSGTGNTEIMANAISNGITEAGGQADVINVCDFKGDIKDYAKVAFGCPSMGNEVLEESDFEPFFSAVENKLSGKKIALFGSYGWGDGQWMRDWEKRCDNCNANLFKAGLIINSTPDASAIEKCKTFGAEFAAY